MRLSGHNSLGAVEDPVIENAAASPGCIVFTLPGIQRVSLFQHRPAWVFKGKIRGPSVEVSRCLHRSSRCSNESKKHSVMVFNRLHSQHQPQGMDCIIRVALEFKRSLSSSLYLANIR